MIKFKGQRPKVGDEIEVQSKQLAIPWTKVTVGELTRDGLGFEVRVGASIGVLPWNSDEWRWPGQGDGTWRPRTGDLPLPQPDPMPTEERPTHELVIEDLQRRAAQGKVKYGMYLQPSNGRDSLFDAYDEVCDLQAYIKNEIRRRSQGGEMFYVVTGQLDATDTTDAPYSISCQSYEIAEQLLAKRRAEGRADARILVAHPVGDIRERRGQQLAVGLAEELTDLKRELEEAQSERDSAREQRNAAEQELKVTRADMDNTVLERTAVEREKLMKARDVVAMNALRTEVELLRETVKRYNLGGEMHIKIAKESQFATQLEHVKRVALGQPLAEEGSFSFSDAAKIVDELWTDKKQLETRVASAVNEMSKLSANGANATLVVRAMRAALEER